MPNLELTCITCNVDFYVSEADQEFFKDQGFDMPKRCWDCRQDRKQEKTNQAKNAVKKVYNTWEDE